MTGLTDTAHVLRAFNAGGIDYVTKPIRPPEVLARMAAHMRAAGQARQAHNALDAFAQATLALRLQEGQHVKDLGNGLGAGLHGPARSGLTMVNRPATTWPCCMSSL
jgi:DNA-binding response OmpR family regulator